MGVTTKDIVYDRCVVYSNDIKSNGKTASYVFIGFRFKNDESRKYKNIEVISSTLTQMVVRLSNIKKDHSAVDDNSSVLALSKFDTPQSLRYARLRDNVQFRDHSATNGKKNLPENRNCRVTSINIDGSVEITIDMPSWFRSSAPAGNTAGAAAKNTVSAVTNASVTLLEQAIDLYAKLNSSEKVIFNMVARHIPIT